MEDHCIATAMTVHILNFLHPDTIFRAVVLTPVIRSFVHTTARDATGQAGKEVLRYRPGPQIIPYELQTKLLKSGGDYIGNCYRGYQEGY